jgi:putative SOS response-associated peptidase YedK
MPVILESDEWEPWLDTSIPNPGPLIAMLDAYPQEEMEMVPVTRRVGNPRYDHPDCVEAVPMGSN